jgi:phosphoglycolate phosphatase
MTTPQGMVFDLDGTLLNTLEDLADSVNLVLREHGLPIHPLDAYRYFVGDGAAVLMTRVIPEAKLTEELHAACLARFREVYATHWKVKSRPYDGILEMLRGVAQRGIRMTVLSNKPHDATEACVGEFLKSVKFAIIQGQIDGVPRKPDPAGALAIARQLSIPPEQFWYLGDTATDMQTAVVAGMFPIGVAWGFRPVGELRDNGAKVIIDAPHQLVGLLDRGRSS